MNKKRIGALLIGATLLVGALGSFAYFTGRTNVISGNGEDGKLQKLTITNGNVVVSSEVTNNGTDLLDWSYDVVEHSLEEDVVRDEAFINANRTPDIDKAAKSEVNGLNRVEIGAALPTEINFTRPGDAIVLGVENADGETGLVVTNKSNLTVKMQLVAKTDEASKAMIKAMKDAGWEMYVEGELVDLETANVVDLGVVGPNGVSQKVVDVRFELPLLTENDKQNATNTNASVSGLNLSDVFEIQATQENNGGWNQDGSGDRITDDTEIK